MQLEIGKIYEGKVTGITKFGAFIEISPGVTGMVHISEIALSYVNEIKDHLSEGQSVKVKVLSLGENGKKYSFSIKKALEPEKPTVHKQPQAGRTSSGRAPQAARSASGFPQSGGRPAAGKPGAGGGVRGGRIMSSQGSMIEPSGDVQFEDMLNRFKQHSDERMSDIKHIIDNKRRGSRRK